MNAYRISIVDTSKNLGFGGFNPNACSRMICSCCGVLPKATQHVPTHALSRDTMASPLNILDLTITG